MHALRLIASFLFRFAVATTVIQGTVAFSSEIDNLAISKDFFTIDRRQVFVAEVPQPRAHENNLKLAPTMGTVMTEQLVSNLRRVLPDSTVERLQVIPEGGDGLLVEAYFSRIVPGSRAKRFWIGFGLGKSSLEITGTIKELATGRIVAQFTQERMSFCCGFGSNDTEIRDNLELAASDIAPMVAGRFRPQQDYEWLDDALTKGPESPVPAVAVTTGTVRIEASVPNADVDVDGKYVGTAPIELPLPAGTHTIVVRKRGFFEWRRDLSVVVGGKQGLVAELAPDDEKAGGE